MACPSRRLNSNKNEGCTINKSPNINYSRKGKDARGEKGKWVAHITTRNTNNKDIASTRESCHYGTLLKKIDAPFFVDHPHHCRQLQMLFIT